jgi:hypothetical protein
VWLAFGRKAAGKTILITLTVAFIGFIGLIIWIMNAYPSNTPSTQSTNSAYNQPIQFQPISNEAQPTTTTSGQLTPDQICKRDVGASSEYLLTFAS